MVLKGENVFFVFHYNENWFHIFSYLKYVNTFFYLLYSTISRSTGQSMNIVNYYGQHASKTDHKRRIELLDKLKLSGNPYHKKVYFLFFNLHRRYEVSAHHAIFAWLQNGKDSGWYRTFQLFVYYYNVLLRIFIILGFIQNFFFGGGNGLLKNSKRVHDALDIFNYDSIRGNSKIIHFF